MPTKPWLTAKVVVAAVTKVEVAVTLPSESTQATLLPALSYIWNWSAPAASPKIILVVAVARRILASEPVISKVKV